jgi:hypothetical protein
VLLSVCIHGGATHSTPGKQPWSTVGVEMPPRILSYVGRHLILKRAWMRLDAGRLGVGVPLYDLFVPNADSMYQDWSASAIELRRCDRQWCRVPPRIDLSAASLLPIDLLIPTFRRLA